MAALPDAPSMNDRPWLLAVDTATPQAGVAVTDGDRMAVTSWPGGRQQTTSVPETIVSLLARCGVGLDEVGAVAVTTGPGSFTGLRVGLSLAKGLVMMPPRALIGVPTLRAMAAPLLDLEAVVIAAIPAGRGRVVWATAEDGIVGEPANSTFEEFIAQAECIEGGVVIGEFDDGQAELLRMREVSLAPATIAISRVASLAAIGYARWRRGEIADAVGLQPVYLHGRPNPR